MISSWSVESHEFASIDDTPVLRRSLMDTKLPTPCMLTADEGDEGLTWVDEKETPMEKCPVNKDLMPEWSRLDQDTEGCSSLTSSASSHSSFHSPGCKRPMNASVSRQVSSETSPVSVSSSSSPGRWMNCFSLARQRFVKTERKFVMDETQGLAVTPHTHRRLVFHTSFSPKKEKDPDSPCTTRLFPAHSTKESTSAIVTPRTNGSPVSSSFSSSTKQPRSDCLVSEQREASEHTPIVAKRRSLRQEKKRKRSTEQTHTPPRTLFSTIVPKKTNVALAQVSKKTKFISSQSVVQVPCCMEAQAKEDVPGGVQSSLSFTAEQSAYMEIERWKQAAREKEIQRKEAEAKEAEVVQAMLIQILQNTPVEASMGTLRFTKWTIHQVVLRTLHSYRFSGPDAVVLFSTHGSDQIPSHARMGLSIQRTNTLSLMNKAYQVIQAFNPLPRFSLATITGIDQAVADGWDDSYRAFFLQRHAIFATQQRVARDHIMPLLAKSSPLPTDQGASTLATETNPQTSHVSKQAPDSVSVETMQAIAHVTPFTAFFGAYFVPTAPQTLEGMSGAPIKRARKKKTSSSRRLYASDTEDDEDEEEEDDDYSPPVMRTRHDKEERIDETYRPERKPASMAHPKQKRATKKVMTKPAADSHEYTHSSVFSLVSTCDFTLEQVYAANKQASNPYLATLRLSCLDFVLVFLCDLYDALIRLHMQYKLGCMALTSQDVGFSNGKWKLCTLDFLFPLDTQIPLSLAPVKRIFAKDVLPTLTGDEKHTNVYGVSAQSDHVKFYTLTRALVHSMLPRLANSILTTRVLHATFCFPPELLSALHIPHASSEWSVTLHSPGTSTQPSKNPLGTRFFRRFLACLYHAQEAALVEYDTVPVSFSPVQEANEEPCLRPNESYTISVRIYADNRKHQLLPKLCTLTHPTLVLYIASFYCGICGATV